MTTDPAERRHIVRGAIECAIRLAPGTRDRQTGPLTTTVWRVVEPALAQRDAQLDAVREVVAAMGGATGAGFWVEQLRAALRPQPPAAATPQPPLTWCGASMPGVGGEPIGPCVLRAGHDGPVHQAADGAKWWPTEERPPKPVDWATVPLTVKVYGAVPRPCESGRHTEHPGYTCDEADGDVAAWTQFLDDLYQRAMSETTATTDCVPAPLRGPNAPPPAGDSAPLRRLAEQALAEFADQQEEQL